MRRIIFLELEDEEITILISALTMTEEILIDDAMDDPEADHSTKVPIIQNLIQKFKEA
jgi:hypothetical protein